MNDCCREQNNLVETQERPDLVVSVCRVCGCRHFELTVAPVVVFAKGSSEAHERLSLVSHTSTQHRREQWPVSQQA